jgi:transketolase
MIDYNQLKEKSTEIRCGIISSIYQARDGHPGPSLGVTDMLVALYYGVMNHSAVGKDNPDRDRCILSKGHACPALYTILADTGYFPKENLPTLRRFGSILQGHPCIETPGIEMTSGSLGNGIAIGLGFEIARKLDGRDYYTYVITGDGELNEGVIWEGVMAAKQNEADHLIVLVDNNGHQSGGEVVEISGVEPIGEKFKEFGWAVQKDIDGNDCRQVLEAIEKAKLEKGRPSAIICKTIKGKGVSFMENNNAWHKGTFTDEQYATAISDIKEGWHV